MYIVWYIGSYQTAHTKFRTVDKLFWNSSVMMNFAYNLFILQYIVLVVVDENIILSITIFFYIYM